LRGKLAGRREKLMAAGLNIALAMLAQVAAAPAPARPPAQAAPSTTVTEPVPDCSEPNADSNRIVICTERPQGYRLDPDVMEAKRETHSGGRPVRPGGKVIPDCATGVGPQPCSYGGVNLIGVALTAAEMAKRVANGEEVGSMFKTDPNPTEYQLYLMAKAQREQEELEKAAAEEREKAAARQKDAEGTVDSEGPSRE
jgi:hypothetical protein